MKTILFIFGTRPETIKLAPVILEFRKHPDQFRVLICNTEQQKDLSNQTLEFFGLKADINLDIMAPNQSLNMTQSRMLAALAPLFESHQIDASIVQGDTLSVLCGALTSFYFQVPVFHVEAGLRSYDLFEPFPEEAIRQMVSRIASLHFAPTNASKTALSNEGISSELIHVTGNTVIDALNCLSVETMKNAENYFQECNVKLNDKVVLLTIHRRENHGERLDSILSAFQIISKEFEDHQFIFSVHPNPNVKEKVYKAFVSSRNVIIMEPLDYHKIVCLMKNAKLIITDSGGIQEEAPAFGVPILVARYETERKEGIDMGIAKLVGAETKNIIKEMRDILKLPFHESRTHAIQNPYGDGNASARILSHIQNYFNK